ncbi:MAG: hypothetical protein Q9184_005005 [Pyrenodesmia sp. 2 TL-2023]
MDNTGAAPSHERADTLVKEFETRINILDRLITQATTTQHTATVSVIGKLLPRQLTELRQHVENIANELRPFIADHKEAIERDKAAAQTIIDNDRAAAQTIIDNDRAQLAGEREAFEAEKEKSAATLAADRAELKRKQEESNSEVQRLAELKGRLEQQRADLTVSKNEAANEREKLKVKAKEVAEADGKAKEILGDRLEIDKNRRFLNSALNHVKESQDDLNKKLVKVEADQKAVDEIRKKYVEDNASLQVELADVRGLKEGLSIEKDQVIGRINFRDEQQGIESTRLEERHEALGKRQQLIDDKLANMLNDLQSKMSLQSTAIEVAKDQAAKLENERKEFEAYKRATEKVFVEREAALKFREANISKAKTAVQEVVENLAKEQREQLPIPHEGILTAIPSSITIDNNTLDKLKDALSYDLKELKISTDDLEEYVRELMKKILPQVSDLQTTGRALNERIEDIYDMSQNTTQDLSRLTTMTNAISDKVSQTLTMRSIDTMSPGGILSRGVPLGPAHRAPQQSLSNIYYQESETGDDEGSRKRRRAVGATDDNESLQGSPTGSPVVPRSGSISPEVGRGPVNRSKPVGKGQKRSTQATKPQLQSLDEASDQTKAMFYQIVLPTDNWTEDDTLQMLRTIEAFWVRGNKDPAVRPDLMFEKVANKEDDGCYNSQQQKLKPPFRETGNTNPCTKCVSATGTQNHPCFKVEYVSEEPGQYDANSTEKRWRLVKRPW